MQTFERYLGGLVLFCSDAVASEWRTIWQEWTYSETVIFAIELREHKKKQAAEIENIEDPMAMMLALLMQRFTP